MEVTLILSERGREHWDRIREVLAEAMADAGVAELPVQETLVRDDEDALAARCIGSPTIRVNGNDVEYMEREPDERSAGVRYFSTVSGWKPVPEKGMIVRALRKAQELESGT